MIKQSFSFIDAHIHLDLYEADERDRLIQEAQAGDVAAVVAVSMNLASCETTSALAKQYSTFIMPAYGYHPEQPLPSLQEQQQLLDWMTKRHVAAERFAIGEVGLPYYTRQEAAAAGEPFDEQLYIDLLEKFVKLASEWQRPIVLHAVYEDAAKALQLLQQYNVKHAHFHWFKGDEQTISEMIAAGYYVSITPDVRYEEEIQQLVKRYPLELLMVETDGPWPFEQIYAGTQTVPSMVVDVVQQIANLKKLDVQEAANQLLKNTKQFYNM
ncbi:TatD family hydrolase [Paenibacillus yanchengensis]|uniref:TatD family hydrolase n=1 Tax=Paenibacillus yanchengensis TaxID=2035833 RepID=A0ABW4YN15_9BACL